MVFIALISFLRYSCIACEPPTPLISQLHLPALLFFLLFPLFSLFLFLLFLLFLLQHFSSLLRFYHPLRKVVRVRVPRSHLVAVHGFSWRVSAFIIYPHTHSNYHRAYRPCQIFLRGIENDSACIIQRALSMPRSSTFYPCTHTERYDRFIIYARCQSWPVALNVLIF